MHESSVETIPCQQKKNLSLLDDDGDVGMMAAGSAYNGLVAMRVRKKRAVIEVFRNMRTIAYSLSLQLMSLMLMSQITVSSSRIDFSSSTPPVFSGFSWRRNERPTTDLFARF